MGFVSYERSFHTDLAHGSISRTRFHIESLFHINSVQVSQFTLQFHYMSQFTSYLVWYIKKAKPICGRNVFVSSLSKSKVSFQSLCVSFLLVLCLCVYVCVSLFYAYTASCLP